MSAAALVNTGTRFSPPRHRAGRALAFRLRSVASRLLPEEAVARCGRRTITGRVAITLKEGRGCFAGVSTCGSVWGCPYCAGKVAAERAEEVRDLADAHCRAGGEVFMAAFTMPHHRFQTAKELRWAITKAWSKVIAGEPWKRACERVGGVAWIKSLEVTHGANGWHPHLHALFFLPAGGDHRRFGDWLFDRWCRVLARAGYGECNPAVWRFERAAHLDAATDYVVKGNFDQELTRGHMKRARGGGRSPWQLLEDADGGDRQAAALFREFFAAFKGAKQLTFSKGLRDDARSDEEIAADAAGALVCHVESGHFRRIMYLGQGAALLDAAEDAGAVGVQAFLASHGLKGGVTCPAPD